MRTLLFAITILALATPGVRAEPDKRADTLFRQGRALLDAGDLAAACAAFDDSQRLDPAISTMLNQADCREKAGQLATAWERFRAVAGMTATAADARSQKFHDVAIERGARLEPRLSRLTIAVNTPVAGLVVVRDRTVVAATDWDRPLPIDGGTYTISARAPDHEPWTTTIHVAPERGLVTIEVPLLAPTPHTTGPTRDAPRTAVEKPSRTLTVVFVGAAAITLGGAVGFERWGASTYGRAKSETNPNRQLTLWHSANAQRHVALGMTALGVGCAGVAAWMVWHGREETAPRPHVSISPLAGRGTAGFVLDRDW